jgi:hypothetical protein
MQRFSMWGLVNGISAGVRLRGFGSVVLITEKK